MLKIIGVIPARYESSRFPGKPLIDLKGKSMIQRVYEGAKDCARLNEVIVATDDERIFQEVESFGGKVVMTSKDHPTGTDRCGEVLGQIDADVVINIQGDEPLVNTEQLEDLCEVFNDSNVSIATLGYTEVSDEDMYNTHRVKLVCDKNGDALYFSRSAIPNAERGNTEEIRQYPFRRHIGLYAYRSETLKELVNLAPTALEKIESLEQLRWLYHGYRIRVVDTNIETPNIDTREDLDAVLKLL